MWTVVLAVVLAVSASVFTWLRRWMSTNRDNDSYLKQKFAVKDGITFYDSATSPCARRVRTTLYEKGIKHSVVDVDLFTRENRHPSYLAINPLGKVPAVVVHNVEGIPDCCLFESNAITEWLDEQFPNTIQLYPSDPWERAQVKMWQRWEMEMAEDFWPMMYCNTVGFVNRARHSRAEYQKHLSKGDPYQVSKMMKTYDGEFLTPRQVQRTAVRLFRWLDLLENSLNGKRYLCGGSFTTADISVLPRVKLYPLIGLLTTDEESKRYPNLIHYMNSLTTRKSIHDAERTDMKIWVIKWIPWSVVEWIGNWRSGKEYHRVYGKDVLRELETSRHDELLIPTELSAEGNDVLLYSHMPWPDSIMTRIACLELGVHTEIKEINMFYLEQRSAGYLSFNTNGAVPTACHDGRIIYDPKNIIEYLDTVFSDISGASLLPVDPTDRVRMRMWQGWMNTCFNYQVIHLYRKCIVGSILKSEFTSEENLLQVLHKSTTAPEYVNDLVDIFNSDSSGNETESKLSPYRLGLGKALEYLDHELSGREYLVSSKLSVADISVFSMVMLFKWLGIIISEGRYPNVATWVARLSSLPSFSVVLSEVEEYMLSHSLQAD